MISYYLKGETKGGVEVTIEDSAGQKIAELRGTGNAGINRITWNLRHTVPFTQEGQVDRRFRAQGPYILPGEYQVKLKVAEQEMTKGIEVQGDPRIDVSFEDRKAQHDALMDILNLYPLLSAASSASDRLKNEMDKQVEVLKKIKDVPEVVSEKIKAVSEEIEDIRIKLLGDPELGRRGMRASVRGRISTTGRSIGG